MNQRPSERATPQKPIGFTAVGIFLCFGAAMAALAATTLLIPNTALDKVWTLNPEAYRQLAPIGRVAGTPFVVLSAALAVRRLVGFAGGPGVIAWPLRLSASRSQAIL